LIKKQIEVIVTIVMNIKIIVEIIDAVFKFDWPSCKDQLFNIQKKIVQYNKNADANIEIALKTNLFELLNFIMFHFICSKGVILTFTLLFFKF
jgi:hypothetical protein